MNKEEKVLIIGGVGFIGSHLSEALLKLKQRVVIIDDLSTKAVAKIDSRIKTYKVNIENSDKVKEIFKKEKPDIVYHLAGAINLRRDIKDPLFAESLNVLGRTKIILDFCQKNKVKKIIFLSSGGAIYSKAETIPSPENYPAHPVSLYGLANLIIEKYLELYYQKYNLNYIVLRLSNVYGPRQWESGIIPSMIIKLLNKERVIIYDDGEQTRDFIYVDDVVRASITAGEKEKIGIYNIGTSKETSLNEVFNIIREIVNPKAKADYQKSIKDEVRRSALDIKKIKKEFGWQPKTDLERGLLKTVQWFKKK